MNLAGALADADARRWLARLDPRLKLAGLFWVSALGILLDAPVALAALLLCVTAAASGLKLRASAWAFVIGLLLLVTWSTLVSQALFYSHQPRTPLATIIAPFEIAGRPLSGLRVYREGLAYGLTQSLRMLAMTLAGLTVCLSTSPERLLAALVRLRMSTALSFMVVTAVRFLPAMLTEWSTVRQARRLRGYRPRLGRWGGEVALLLPVLAAVLRRAQSLTASVESRGFDPTARRTSYPLLRFRAGERVVLLALLGTVLAIVSAKLLYWLYLGDLYYHPALRQLYSFVRLWL